MIKNLQKYRIEQEKERKNYLQSLTYKKSAKIAEGLLSVVHWFKKNFSKDDNPMSLRSYIEELKWKKRNIRNSSKRL